MVRHNLSSVPQLVETHIAYEEMAAYVDGDLGAMGREEVEAHITACADCKNGVDDLMRLREAIAPDQEAVAAVSQASAPLWQRASFRIGLEALVALLIVVSVGWFSARQIKLLRVENEQLRKSLGESEAAIAELEQRIASVEQ